eukprot:Pgem_evm1s18847
MEANLEELRFLITQYEIFSEILGIVENVGSKNEAEYHQCSTYFLSALYNVK